MKISELNTDQALDVLCESAPYLGNIIEDASLTLELKRKLKIGAGASQAEIIAAGIDKIAKLVPIILRAHREDVYAIIAAVNGKTLEDVSKQNALKTAGEIKDIVKDKAFLDFFKSLRDTENK